MNNLSDIILKPNKIYYNSENYNNFIIYIIHNNYEMNIFHI